MTNSIVELIQVVKVFTDEGDAAVTDVSLQIKRGEFLTLLGPSGCGKTTTLRMIAGFEQPTSGKILVDNEDVSNTPPYKRNVNTVFQNYALFPHMSIFDNIAFGLQMKKVPREQIETKVFEMLKMVQLEGYENRMPDQLSGGQKQRVAIARAVINNPKVLLLDEPLGALDLKLRKQMQVELKHLQRKLGITFIYVTHDQEEALTMSDRIAVMNKGALEQVGTPDEIYEKPRTKFVADFIGETNLFEGEVSSIDAIHPKLQLEGGESIPLKWKENNSGDRICMALRPERLKLKSVPEEVDAFVKVKFKEKIYVGATVKTIVTLSNGKEIIVSEPVGGSFNFDKDKEDAFVTWNFDHAVVMKS